jgi:hypothetical protein
MGIEVDNLTNGMDAGVGTASALNGYWFIGHHRQGRFDHRLDTRAVHLTLPPTEGAAVVFNAERDAHIKGEV